MCSTVERDGCQTEKLDKQSINGIDPGSGRPAADTKPSEASEPPTPIAAVLPRSGSADLPHPPVPTSSHRSRGGGTATGSAECARGRELPMLLRSWLCDVPTSSQWPLSASATFLLELTAQAFSCTSAWQMRAIATFRKLTARVASTIEVMLAGCTGTARLQHWQKNRVGKTTPRASRSDSRPGSIAPRFEYTVLRPGTANVDGDHPLLSEVLASTRFDELRLLPAIFPRTSELQPWTRA